MPETGNPKLMTETASGNPVHKNPKKENLRREIDTPVRIIPRRIVNRFRGGLVFKAHRLLYRSTLDWRVI